MNNQEFERICNDQINQCMDVLYNKASEYAEDIDRLHNFNIAAKLRGCTPIQALSGMMIKHTVSIYDMCESGEDYHQDLWDEKITDHINYLLLLQVIIYEDSKGFCCDPVETTSPNIINRNGILGSYDLNEKETCRGDENI